MNKSAKEFIGNPDYPAISYGGYREKSREQQPTINEICLLYTSPSPRD